MEREVREVLEAAFAQMHGLTMAAEDWDALGWIKADRFRRFLDAEAWTDAAFMLIPDNWTAWEMRSHAARSHFSADLSRLSECDAGHEDWAHGRGMHPALALAEAALRAKEAGNG